MNTFWTLVGVGLLLFLGQAGLAIVINASKDGESKPKNPFKGSLFDDESQTEKYGPQLYPALPDAKKLAKKKK